MSRLCPTCYGEFTEEGKEARILSCGHTLCTYCISKILINDRRCPTCRKLFNPESTISSFPKNFTLQSILEESTQKKCIKHKQLLNVVCLDCKQEICVSCLKYSHKGHNFESKEDFVNQMRTRFNELGAWNQKRNQFYESNIKPYRQLLEGKHMDKVKNYYDGLISTLQEQKRRLMDQVKSHFDSCEKELTEPFEQQLSVAKSLNLQDLRWPDEVKMQFLFDVFSVDVEKFSMAIQDFTSKKIESKLIAMANTKKLEFDFNIKEDIKKISRLRDTSSGEKADIMINFHNEIAQELAAKEKYQAAITFYTQMLENDTLIIEDSQRVGIYLAMGQIYAQSGDIENAKKYYGMSAGTNSNIDEFEGLQISEILAQKKPSKLFFIFDTFQKLSGNEGDFKPRRLQTLNAQINMAIHCLMNIPHLVFKILGSKRDLSISNGESISPVLKTLKNIACNYWLTFKNREDVVQLEKHQVVWAMNLNINNPLQRAASGDFIQAIFKKLSIALNRSDRQSDLLNKLFNFDIEAQYYCPLCLAIRKTNITGKNVLEIPHLGELKALKVIVEYYSGKNPICVQVEIYEGNTFEHLFQKVCSALELNSKKFVVYFMDSIDNVQPGPMEKQIRQCLGSLNTVIFYEVPDLYDPAKGHYLINLKIKQWEQTDPPTYPRIIAVDPNYSVATLRMKIYKKLRDRFTKYDQLPEIRDTQEKRITQIGVDSNSLESEFLSVTTLGRPYDIFAIKDGISVSLEIYDDCFDQKMAPLLPDDVSTRKGSTCIKVMLAHRIDCAKLFPRLQSSQVYSFYEDTYSLLNQYHQNLPIGNCMECFNSDLQQYPWKFQKSPNYLIIQPPSQNINNRKHFKFNDNIDLSPYIKDTVGNQDLFNGKRPHIYQLLALSFPNYPARQQYGYIKNLVSNTWYEIGNHEVRKANMLNGSQIPWPNLLIYKAADLGALDEEFLKSEEMGSNNLFQRSINEIQEMFSVEQLIGGGTPEISDTDRILELDEEEEDEEFLSLSSDDGGAFINMDQQDDITEMTAIHEGVL